MEQILFDDDNYTISLKKMGEDLYSVRTFYRKKYSGEVFNVEAITDEYYNEIQAKAIARKMKMTLWSKFYDI